MEEDFWTCLIVLHLIWLSFRNSMVLVCFIESYFDFFEDLVVLDFLFFHQILVLPIDTNFQTQSHHHCSWKAVEVSFHHFA